MSKQHDSFRNSEWGPGAAEAMCKEVRDFKVPGGKHGQVTTMGDLIDRTPKHLISKVMLEEKVFDTWYGGRTVLLGDGKPYTFISSSLAMSSCLSDVLTICSLYLNCPIACHKVTQRNRELSSISSTNPV